MPEPERDPLAEAQEAALRQLHHLALRWCWPLLVVALWLTWNDTGYRTANLLILVALLMLAWGVQRSAWRTERRAGLAVVSILVPSLFVMAANAPRGATIGAAVVALTVSVLFFGMRVAFVVFGLYAAAATLNLVLTAKGWVTPMPPDFQQPVPVRILLLLVLFGCLWFGARILQMTIRIYRDARAAAVERLQAMLDAQREVELLQRRELVNVVTAGLTHDLANTVQTMTGTAALLEEASTPDEARHAARDLRRVGDEVAARMRAILSVGRADRDGTGSTSVRGLFSRLDLLLPSMLGRGVTLALEPGVDATLAIGQGRLEQVLVNLALNARDAMPSGGVVRVRSRPDDGGTAIDVSDGGTGIPDELLGRIFEPYVTTKAPGRGTGLGLAVVRRIVDSAHGRVSVRSEPGKGSTFTVWIPGASA